MEAPAIDDASAVPAGYFRAKSGTLCKLPNPARSGKAVCVHYSEEFTASLKAEGARKTKPVKATLKKLAEAHEKALAANTPGTSEAQVRRANAVVDRAYLLPVQSIEEFAGMLRVALASDGDSMDAPYRQAIANVAAGLALMCAEDAAA